ncbi:MAG: hypothetical protein BGP25_12880 [Lysobacterales bacterium 63-13]|nr:MAG: hypothetical protein BGP25_12880 [Xanthomonadales bacterium 63-13]
MRFAAWPDKPTVSPIVPARHPIPWPGSQYHRRSCGTLRLHRAGRFACTAVIATVNATFP